MDSKLRELLQAAVSKTESGSLPWTAFDSESFRTRVGRGHIHVQRTAAYDAGGNEVASGYRYAVQVSNSPGQVVAEAEAREGDPDPDLTLVKSLFTAARTAGLGGYEVIDGMIHALQQTS